MARKRTTPAKASADSPAPSAGRGLKVFISWSGPRSNAVAEALRGWLPMMFDDVIPFVSSQDINAGDQWGAVLSGELGETHFGILCLTPENREAPWILFEAGALSKAFGTARVVPFLLGMSPGDVRAPLGQFNAVTADREGTLRLVESVNGARPVPTDIATVRGRFGGMWGELEGGLATAVRLEEAKNARRDTHDMLEEMLGLVRDLHRGRPAVAASARPIRPAVARLQRGGKTLLLSINLDPKTVEKLSDNELEELNTYMLLKHYGAEDRYIHLLIESELSKRYASKSAE